jgi:hypothetical protein
MSHQRIILKVWGGDAEEAEAEARSTLEESIELNNNTCGWEYVDDILLITKDMLQPEFNVSSYGELEKKMLQKRQTVMDDLIGDLKEELLPTLAPLFMTKNDAVLLINTENDSLKVYIEKFLKQKKDIKKPDTFETLSETILNLLVFIAKKDSDHSMIMWRMERIKKLQYCFEDPHPSNTLQSFENPYAEIPCDNKKGLSPYFFIGNRKC